MWETILLEVMKSIIVPELASFIRERFEATGEWPTQAEMEGKVHDLANQIKFKGKAFLDRPDDGRKVGE